MIVFKNIKYGKRPTVIYVSMDEYSANSSFKNGNIYHKTPNGTFYVGNYRYKKTIGDNIIVLRRSIF